MFREIHPVSRGSEIQTLNETQLGGYGAQLSRPMHARHLEVDSSSFSPILPGPTSPLAANDSRACPGLFSDVGKDVLTGRLILFEGWGINGRILMSTPLSYILALLRVLILGNLLSHKTNDIGISETLLATVISGAIYSSLSKQPVIIIGISGSMTLFIIAVHEASNNINIDFISWWSCIGLWCSGTLLLLAALNACRLTSLFTSFGFEILRSFMGLTFIWESVDLLISLFEKPNSESSALLSLWIASGTFIFAFFLAGSRNWLYFNEQIRKFFSSYSSFLTLILFTALQSIPEFSKLSIPHADMHPSKRSKSSAKLLSIVDLNSIPLWAGILAALPGTFLAILIFIDHNATAVLLQKSMEIKHDVGSRSWDLLLLSFLFLFCALLGLPFVYGLFYPSKQMMDSITILHPFEHARMDEESLSQQSHWFKINGWRTASVLSYALLAFALIPAFQKLFSLVPHALLIGLLAQMGYETLASLDMMQRIHAFLMDKSKAEVRTNMPNSYDWMTANFTLVQVMGTVTIFAIALSPMGVFFPLAFFFLVLFCSFCLGNVYGRRRVMEYRNARSDESGRDEMSSVRNDATVNSRTVLGTHRNVIENSSNNAHPSQKEQFHIDGFPSHHQEGSLKQQENRNMLSDPFPPHSHQQHEHKLHNQNDQHPDSISEDSNNPITQRFHEHSQNNHLQIEYANVRQGINRIRSEPTAFLDMDGKKRVKKKTAKIRVKKLSSFSKRKLERNKKILSENELESMIHSRKQRRKERYQKKKKDLLSSDHFTPLKGIESGLSSVLDEDERSSIAENKGSREEDAWTYIYSNSVYSPDRTPRSKSLDVDGMDERKKDRYASMVSDPHAKYVSKDKKSSKRTKDGMGKEIKKKKEELDRWVEESWRVLQYNWLQGERKGVSKDREMEEEGEEKDGSDEIIDCGVVNGSNLKVRGKRVKRSISSEDCNNSKFSLNVGKESDQMDSVIGFKTSFSPVSSPERLLHGMESGMSIKQENIVQNNKIKSNNSTSNDNFEHGSVSIRGEKIPAVSSIIQRLKVGGNEEISMESKSAEEKGKRKMELSSGTVSKATEDSVVKNVKSVKPKHFIQKNKTILDQKNGGNDNGVNDLIDEKWKQKEKERALSESTLDDGVPSVGPSYLPQQRLASGVLKMKERNMKSKH